MGRILFSKSKCIGLIITSSYLLMLILIAGCSTSTNPPANKINAEEDYNTIKSMEYDWLKAEFKLDTATIAAMMSDSFIGISSTGIIGKHEELRTVYENINNRLKEGHVIDSFYLDDFQVHFSSNTAIVTFFAVTKGRNKDQPFENRRTFFNDVWVKENGKWKAIASQVTRIQTDQ